VIREQLLLRLFVYTATSDRIRSMERSDKLTPALRRAQEEGIDLTLLYERLSWTPTERLTRNYEAAEAFEELRKAGQKHRAGKQH
jgi:hypothetical protein